MTTDTAVAFAIGVYVGVIAMGMVGLYAMYRICKDQDARLRELKENAGK